MTYEIRSAQRGQGFTPYGAAREFLLYKGPECLIHGPSETGKTITALYKLHICACKYPKASIVIARKTLSSTVGTVLQTFINKVLDKHAPVEIYGGNKPEWFDYPNGSRIWVAGLDKSSKILSAEHDIIYVNQTEELTLDDWETLTTRTTGRSGNMPYAQTIGDCNPSYPGHWMYHRPSLHLFYSIHRDNPALYENNGNLTEQGKRTMAVLEALTGARRQRLLEGKPAQAEGVIYDEWDESRHLIYADKLPVLTRFIGAQDWGYNHPGVLGVWGIDGDGSIYLTAQVYRTRQTIDWWAYRAVELQKQFNLETIVCDPSQPAHIAQYKQAGVRAQAANNDVLAGINAVKQRLSKNRLFVVRDSSRHIDQSLRDAHRPYRVEDEFPGYVWADSKNKEVPVKELDDGMDMTRYAVMYVDYGKYTQIGDLPQDKGRASVWEVTRARDGDREREGPTANRWTV